MKIIADYTVPLIFALTSIYILFSGNDLFSEFVRGAREGLGVTLRLLPTLVILVTCVSMFNASGALDLLCAFFEKPLSLLGVPSEMAPVIIMRPISGSAATAMINTLFANAGPDSFAGRASSVLLGSTDTIIYTMALYFSSCGIKKTRHATASAFLVMLFCIILSCLVTRLYF